ncbi:hypothetical protein [Lentzea sp. E54]|uniref:hypothetical protein n=1 Tax=Lentzea xerophila TaxID=3435883 RepID=UPI003DA283D4
MRFVSVAAVAAIALAGLSSGVAHAESAPGCGPVTQIGKTAYINGDSSGAWASVKQFKGCGKNWAYVYVWDSFVSRVGDFQVATWVETTTMNGYVKAPRNQQAVWSKGTNTLSVCTRAAGSMVDFVSNPDYAHTVKTEKRC